MNFKVLNSWLQRRDGYILVAASAFVVPAMLVLPIVAQAEINGVCCGEWINLSETGAGFAREWNCEQGMKDGSPEFRTKICQQLRDKGKLCPEIALFCVGGSTVKEEKVSQKQQAGKAQEYQYFGCENETKNAIIIDVGYGAWVMQYQKELIVGKSSAVEFYFRQRELYDEEKTTPLPYIRLGVNFKSQDEKQLEVARVQSRKTPKELFGIPNLQPWVYEVKSLKAFDQELALGDIVLTLDLPDKPEKKPIEVTQTLNFISVERTWWTRLLEFLSGVGQFVVIIGQIIGSVGAVILAVLVWIKFTGEGSIRIRAVKFFEWIILKPK